MPRSAAPPAASGRRRKSPLRLAEVRQPSFPSPATRDGRLAPRQLRAMMISEFEQWLRSRTNQEKRPFHEETVKTPTFGSCRRTAPRGSRPAAGHHHLRPRLAELAEQDEPGGQPTVGRAQPAD